MTAIRKLMTTAALVGAVAGTAPAAAQATRTWISGVGDDANPCSRTAPCKTFAGAISKTASGGEINCLDPGGFGGVTVTKAITFLCDTTEGGVLVAGTNGFTINAPDTDVVTISGMDIFGPTSSPGLNGIRFVNGAGVNIRNSTIKGFSGQGVSFEVPAGKTAFLNMENVKIVGSGTTSDTTTGGIAIKPASSAVANVVLKSVSVQNNPNVGLRVELGTVTAAKVNLHVVNSVFSGGDIGISLRGASGNGVVNGSITGSTFVNNTTYGVFGKNPDATLLFSGNTITGNGSATTAPATGVVGAGSALLSYGNNYLGGNFNSTGAASDGAFTGAIAPH